MQNRPQFKQKVQQTVSGNATEQAETHPHKNSGSVRPVQKEVNISYKAELVQQKSVKSVRHASQHCVHKMLFHHRGPGYHDVHKH